MDLVAASTLSHRCAFTRALPHVSVVGGVRREVETPALFKIGIHLLKEIQLFLRGIIGQHKECDYVIDRVLLQLQVEYVPLVDPFHSCSCDFQHGWGYVHPDDVLDSNDLCEDARTASKIHRDDPFFSEVRFCLGSHPLIRLHSARPVRPRIISLGVSLPPILFDPVRQKSHKKSI